MINLKKLFRSTILILLILSPVAYSSDKNCFAVTTDAFLQKLRFAAARVPYGLTNDQIKKDLMLSDTGDFIIPYSTSLMLLIKRESHSNKVKNIAVTFFYNDPEPETGDKYHSSQNNETVFRNICMQILFSLHPKMKAAQAKLILEEIGIQGEIFDGTQRSKSVEDYLYITRLQPNGVAIMLVLCE